MITPTVGRIVHYRLAPEDVVTIQHRGDVTNAVHAGEVVAMVIVKVWPHAGVNGRLFIDGTGPAPWVTSVEEGSASGEWHWPERV